ncbi:heterogeneous nuclear ribonucleoprotein L-like, partial [Petromyzon marinus]|uniref:heterogeneous nuclear ribonucleoprotein L-like n=1 Tax=Petromyzon marinus TaxID=7757 RepID=UPI003F710150
SRYRRKQQLCTIVVLSLLPCRRAQDTFEDPHKPPPSAVVHVRGLLDTALESDLVEAVRHFGLVSYVVMMPKTRQALVEFEDSESSRSCVDYSSTGSVYVCGQPAYINFSTSQKLWRPGVPGDNGKSNHVLLFTILNPIYPITTDVLYNICKPFGPLQRIVIFRKNGLQAFVEFVSVESAERANSSLNGADIYSGCCTLIVDYARATRLDVFKNDSETWDFTNPGLNATSRNTRRSTPRPLHRNRHVPLGRGHRITRVQPQAPGDTALTDRQSTGTAAKKPGATKARIHPPNQKGSPESERCGGTDNAGGCICAKRDCCWRRKEGAGLSVASSSRWVVSRRPTLGNFVFPSKRRLEDNAMMPAKQTSLLGDHPKAHACGGGDCGGHQQPPPPGVDYGSGGDGMGGGGGMGMGVGMGNQVGPQGGTQGQHVQAMMNQQADNNVLIVYDLDAERFNCDRVFNILCLFGDVEKVKFLKSKPGAAMVEMGDQYAVHRAVFHLNMSQIFGNKINLCVSRQRSIVPGQAFELPDGTDSYRDYAGSHNHRYADSEKAAKNRNQHPTAVLHFFNAPTDITAEMFAQLCDEMSIAKPRSFKVFSGKTDRSVSGLTEWETKNDAMEALACINHHPLKNANVPYFYTLKLCFSTAQPS